MEESLRMGQSMHRAHYLQRLQLELTLETIPRDSRYSQQLIDLMKREEVAIRDNCNATSTTELIRRVDDALRVETERFFNKTAEQNVKRWAALQKKIEGEIQRYNEEMSAHPEWASAAAVTSAASAEAACDSGEELRTVCNYRIPTAEEMNRETLRLEEDYNQNWLKYEEYNLRTAFVSQIARVESDWIAQEMALADDFNARKAQLTGQSALDSPSRQAAGGNSDRWQHPEKQKTLIHTAPVLSPTAMRRSRDEPPSADLERLQRQYRAAIENLEKQKAAAIRWMNRQEIRLTAQCKETAAERKSIAAVIRQELNAATHSASVGRR